MSDNNPSVMLENAAYQLKVWSAEDEVRVHLIDKMMGFSPAEGPYYYSAVIPQGAGATVYRGLAQPTVTTDGGQIMVRGKLGPIDVVHALSLPADRSCLEETFTLHNPTDEAIVIEDLACGFQRIVTNRIGALLPNLATDVMTAIPFRHRSEDPIDIDNEFTFAQLLTSPGRELHITELVPLHTGHGYMPSDRRSSEAWAWQHGEYTLGIFKFNQAAMEFSVLSLAPSAEGVCLRFGGTAMIRRDPEVLHEIAPGASVALGLTRLVTVRGTYVEASYAYRALLDENGCRFPDGFNPPVHWNELYDNWEYDLGTAGFPPGKRQTRHLTYTKTQMLEEAAKARAYSCEALYLDPGWDTDFGTFLWADEWLGERKRFIDQVWDGYGLRVSLHCPLATWMAYDGRSVEHWPEASYRKDAEGNVIYINAFGRGVVPMPCLGSRQYLDEAEKRLLDSCRDGVVFLMFDGNWYNTGCWDPTHGHPVPYGREDHVRANVELARRIHAHYPDVLIEMHDMVAGGSVLRYTPVYYKYGLPGSYDVNWGFELMWRPMEDILTGRARALYYYNLGCNVPVYLHVDLRDDNEHALVFWWYASTCRHLGIGGTHDNPQIAELHRKMMARYRQLERYFKRGEFYGLAENIHLHVLEDESSLVINLFNLSDNRETIRAEIKLADYGLDPDRWYITPFTYSGGGFNRNNGTYTASRLMAPWSAQVIELRALDTSARE